MNDVTYWILWAFLTIIFIIGVWWVVGILLEGPRVPVVHGYDPQTPDGIENLIHGIKNYYCVTNGEYCQ